MRTPRAVRRPRLPHLAVLAVALVAAVGGGAAWPSGPAAAHAELLSTTPADGSRADTSPSEVTLTFSETVSAGLGAVRVLDREGARVDDGDVEGRGGVVGVGLDGDLPDGSYVVAWRVVSADSHPIHGSFTFGVGEGAARIDADLVASLLGDDGDGPWKVVGAATRFLAYGGGLVAIGLAVFLALAHDGGPERDRLRTTLRIAAGVGAVGLVAELPVRAALATGLGPDSITEGGVLAQLLGDRVGIALAVALLTLLFVAVDAGREAVVALGGAIALGLALGLSGHTATSTPAWLGTASDAAHVAAAAVWLGGLVGCAVVAHARRREGTSAAAVVVRFSSLAAVALGGVAVAGGLLGWTEVRSLDALRTTAYGQLLMAKVAIVALVAALGAVNRFRLVPVLERDQARERLGPRALRVLRRTLVAEVALLVVVVALTAVLVDVTPARAAVAAPYVGSEPLGEEGRVDIDVDPTRAGPTTIHVYAYDTDGQLMRAPQGVVVRFSLPAAGVTGLERTPDATGIGHWTIEGDDLSIPGTWTVEVLIRLTVYEEATASFQVPIQP